MPYPPGKSILGGIDTDRYALVRYYVAKVNCVKNVENPASARRSRHTLVDGLECISPQHVPPLHGAVGVAFPAKSQ